MIKQMVAVTHSTPMGNLFTENHQVVVFESSTSLCSVFESFTQHLHDVVLISENSDYVGIVTLKDMMRILNDLDNLLQPIRDFMVTPLLTFDSSQSIAEVLDVVAECSCGKIVVKNNNKVIGIMDHSDLLSFCYSQITPLIKYEYNMIHSVLGLASEGNKGLLKLATTDSLTGIGNRRLLEEIFKAHQKNEIRYGITLFLIMFDIDNFKNINDTYGHSIGDLVLQELVTLVSKLIRKSDLFIRWGGEEFAILLQYHDSHSVDILVEKIRHAIDEFTFTAIVHVTCSFGVTKIYPSESLEQVLLRADTALYLAKSDGKNVVRMNF